MFTFRIRKSVVLACILFLQPAFSLFAQEKVSTLTGLIDSAQKNLPLLMQKRALINSSEAAVTDARHSFLPQLKINDQLNIGTDNSLAGSTLPIFSIPSTSGGIRANNNSQAASGNVAVLYSEYELVNFGLKDAKIKNAQAYANVQKADYAKDFYVVKTQIGNLYFNLLRSVYKLKVDGENVSRYQDIYNVIRALAISGIRPGADTALTQAELSKAKVTYNQTLGNINVIKQQLAYWSGVTANQISVDTNSVALMNNNASSFAYSFDSVSNPLIGYYARVKDVYKSNEDLISKSYLPKILLAGSTWARGSSIQYNDNYKNLATGLGYQRYNYMAGISFTYDLFNGIHKKDKLAVSRYQTQASEYYLEQQKQALGSASNQADAAIQVVQNNLKELPLQLQAAKDVYEQKLAQYKAGLINLIDLTNASFVLYRSQNDYIDAMNDLYVAQLNKAVATGNLDSFIQTIK